MDHANQEELRQWVEAQTADLAPPAGWQADSAAAFERFHRRRKANWRTAMLGRWPLLAAAALALALVLSLPAGRGLAQQFWQLLTVPRVAVIRVNPWPEGVPFPAVKLMGRPIPPIPARDAEEARGRVHYAPRLPYPPGMLAGGPWLSTTFTVWAGTVVHVADLELALSRAGITGLSVPSEWDGAQLAVYTSALVIAEWPDITLVQSLPLTLTAPTGFDFEAFSALVLRVSESGLTRRSGWRNRWDRARVAVSDRSEFFQQGDPGGGRAEQRAGHAAPGDWSRWGGHSHHAGLERSRSGVSSQRKVESGVGDFDGQCGAVRSRAPPVWRSLRRVDLLKEKVIFCCREVTDRL